MDRNFKIVVEISNITERQAQGYVALFGWMNKLGNWGASRPARLFYDGDGSARAIITVDGDRATTPDPIDDVQFDFE